MQLRFGESSTFAGFSIAGVYYVGPQVFYGIIAEKLLYFLNFKLFAVKGKRADGLGVHAIFVELFGVLINGLIGVFDGESAIELSLICFELGSQFRLVFCVDLSAR